MIGSGLIKTSILFIIIIISVFYTLRKVHQSHSDRPQPLSHRSISSCAQCQSSRQRSGWSWSCSRWAPPAGTAGTGGRSSSPPESIKILSDQHQQSRFFKSRDHVLSNQRPVLKSRDHVLSNNQSPAHLGADDPGAVHWCAPLPRVVQMLLRYICSSWKMKIVSNEWN